MGCYFSESFTIFSGSQSTRVAICPGSIAATEYTLERLRNSVADGSFRGVSITGLERVIVKGKETPVGIYSVAAIDPGQMATLVDCDPEKIVRLSEK